MLGIVFSVLVLLSFGSALATGNLAALSDAALDGAGRAVTLTVSLMGMMCLFGGVMRVLAAAGLLDRLARLLHPLLSRLFPDAARSGEGLREIAANVAANLLGIGNAATPFALAAMEKLQKHNPHPDTATDDMVTLAVLNSSPPNLLPTTLIALRRLSGSARAAVILVPVWAVSLLCAVLAVLSARLLRYLFPPYSKRKDGQTHDTIPIRSGGPPSSCGAGGPHSGPRPQAEGPV